MTCSADRVSKSAWLALGLSLLLAVVAVGGAGADHGNSGEWEGSFDLANDSKIVNLLYASQRKRTYRCDANAGCEWQTFGGVVLYSKDETRVTLCDVGYPPQPEPPVRCVESTQPGWVLVSDELVAHDPPTWPFRYCTSPGWGTGGDWGTKNGPINGSGHRVTSGIAAINEPPFCGTWTVPTTTVPLEPRVTTTTTTTVPPTTTTVVAGCTTRFNEHNHPNTAWYVCHSNRHLYVPDCHATERRNWRRHVHDASGHETVWVGPCPRVVRMADATIEEGRGRPRIRVWLDKAHTSKVTVSMIAYSRLPGAGIATEDSDYTAWTETVDFPPGVHEKYVDGPPIIDDSLIEPSETFLVRWGGVVNVRRGTWTPATVTITDNDYLTVSAASATVAESAGYHRVVVRLNGRPSVPVSVDVSHRNGSASHFSDYDGFSRFVDFVAGGSRTQAFNVRIQDDNRVEGPETFTVVLSNPVNVVLGSNGTVTITDDDDYPTVTLTADASSVAETSTAGVVLTATLDRAPLTATTARVSTRGAADGGSGCGATAEFYLSGRTFTFPAGTESATLTLFPCADADSIDETVTVKLGSATPAGTRSGNPDTATVTITDPLNPPPPPPTTTLSPADACAAIASYMKWNPDTGECEPPKYAS